MSLIWFIMGIYILIAHRLPPAFIGGSIKYEVDWDTERAIGRILIIPFIMDVFRLLGLNLLLPFPVLLLYILLTYFIPLFAVAHYIHNRYPRHTDQYGFLADTDIPAAQIDLGQQIARQAYRSMFFIGLSLFTPLGLILGPMAVVQTTRAIRESKTHQIATRQRRLAVVTRFLSIIITLLPIAVVLIITFFGSAIGRAVENDLTPDFVGEPPPTRFITRTPTITPLPPTSTSTNTPRPTNTLRPTRTPTPITTPTVEDTPLPLPTPIPPAVRTQTALQNARQLAITGVGSNDEWEPILEEFNGVYMVLVPAGCFMMGSTDEDIDQVMEICDKALGTGHCQHEWYKNEQPQHKVCLSAPFWIDVYEVTGKQYDPPDLTFGYNSPYRAPWADARAYCLSRGARLPTEAEWEYAARGPDGLIYPWGNDLVPGMANLVDDYWADLVGYEVDDGYPNKVEVGSYPEGVSWVGAYDMSGNAWEWVNDWYSEDYYTNSQVYNPWGPAGGEYHVLKGGSWSTRPWYARGAARAGDDLSESVPAGFRCVRSY